ncbi:hypothetical protein IFM89_002323 [Coptis chinensis]|uniref:Pectinesterase catalytic domain-containing protein n=1 Tax=Coptis chinensis TaxID=261450 RepID=A0A835IN46_9MAGN|nr:hypothetical protein IFM89_002323 [Coptis chinensis]
MVTLCCFIDNAESMKALRRNLAWNMILRAEDPTQRITWPTYTSLIGEEERRGEIEREVGGEVRECKATLYYVEYNNSGPGSNTSNRVTWLGYHVIDATDAIKFTVSELIVGDAWLPQTGVPYTGGLVI